MNRFFIFITLLMTASLTGCGDLVPLAYATRAEAEAEALFARGWLPEIIPAFARKITMQNDLDLNESKGEFHFDPSDHDSFVAKLERFPAGDREGFTAYQFQDWVFWIHAEKNRCKFFMRLPQSN